MNTAGHTIPQLGERVVNGSVGLQASLLLEQHRVWVSPTKQFVIVFGRRQPYRINFYSKGTSCSCPAGKKMDAFCSHKTAALIAVAERGDTPIQFPPEVGEQLELGGAS